jgi:outer membrane protein OmpA-like peptidoglycan-associated protein
LAALLLAFFVVLVGMGTTQDQTLFDQGYKGGFTESFKRGFGVRQKFDFGSLANKYGISEPDDLFEGRTTDADTEKLRRIVKKLSQRMKIRPSPVVAQKIDFSVTNIHFLPGDTALNEPAKEFLTRFCLNLQQSSVSNAIRLYVLGLAGDVATEKKQWIVSARRAQAVAEFLRDTLPEGTRNTIYSWGAGSGGDWVSRDSPISDKSQILIALLRDSD